MTKKRIDTGGPGPARRGSRRPSQPTVPEEAAPFVPRTTNLARLAAAAQKCTGCDLYRNATQAVFGEGPQHAHVMFVGEQPGDQEDLQGKPSVGPAGALLDKALGDAAIPRNDVPRSYQDDGSAVRDGLGDGLHDARRQDYAVPGVHR